MCYRSKLFLGYSIFKLVYFFKPNNCYDCYKSIAKSVNNNKQKLQRSGRATGLLLSTATSVIANWLSFINS